MNLKPGSLPHKLVLHAETKFDQLNASYRRKFGYSNRVRVVPYAGFGTPTCVQLRGRVLSDKPVPETDGSWTTFRNVFEMLSRYKTDEVPNARLRIRWGDQVREVVSDAEGYFHEKFNLEEPIRPDRLMAPYEVELLKPHKNGGQETTRFTGEIQVPTAARFGIVSDIDDTIVHTGATNLLRHTATVLLNNARSRTAFPGVAALYTALQNEQGRRENPIFYVSSSPWNLYDFFTDFMDHHGIPKGTMFLKDFGTNKHRWFKESHTKYKHSRIAELFETYPTMRWFLVGDSGQRDPEIYSRLVDEYPDRVLSVYLRDVTGDGRAREVKRIARHIRDMGVPCKLAAETLELAEHAEEYGWISPEDLDAVRRDVYNPKVERRFIGHPSAASG